MTAFFLILTVVGSIGTGYFGRVVLEQRTNRQKLLPTPKSTWQEMFEMFLDEIQTGVPGYNYESIYDDDRQVSVRLNTPSGNSFTYKRGTEWTEIYMAFQKRHRYLEATKFLEENC